MANSKAAMPALVLTGKGALQAAAKGVGKGKDTGKGKGTEQEDITLVLTIAKAKAKGASKAKPKAKAKEPAEHTLRECIVCKGKEHWRRMKSVWIDTTTPEARARAGTSAEKDDVIWGRQGGFYVFTCVKCVAKEGNMTVEEASRSIKEPRTEKQTARAAKFKHEMANIKSVWDFLAVELSELPSLEDATGGAGSSSIPPDSGRSTSASTAMDVDPTVSPDSGRQSGPSAASVPKPALSKTQAKKRMRKLAYMRISEVADIFEPIMHILVLKSKDEEAAKNATEKFQAWLKKGEKGDGEADFQEGDFLEQDLDEKMNKWRSFESKDDQAAMQRAADYSDQWFTSRKGAFNVYYICRAGGFANQCLKVTQSQEWGRLHTDPEATGQRWYCSCWAKYKTTFGVLTEMIALDGKMAYYAIAEFPPQSFIDAKFMAIEERFSKCNTPKELLDALPVVVPMALGVLLKPTLKKGEYQLDRTLIDTIPTLEWFQLFNLQKS